MFFLPMMSILLIVALLLEPTASINAAKNGLMLWFNTVLPSLLPFIIGSNILLASGGISFFEKICNPIMKPLFNVPGKSAFAWVMGLVSGYPMGAKIISQLRMENEITDLQAQRLLGFCNNSGPFFILGAVGVGMLKDENLGYFLLAVHLFSSLLMGILFRFYGQDKSKVSNISKKSIRSTTSVGEILGKSVTSAMEVIVQIGGYIIIFSVVASLLNQTYIVKTITTFICFIFQNKGMTQEAAAGWTIGIIEMSNGVHMVSNAQVTLKLQLSILSFLLAWGGFSIHAQSLHFIRNIHVKSYVYIIAKVLQGTLAFILSWLLFPMYNSYGLRITPVFSTSSYYYFPILSFGVVIAALLLSIVGVKKERADVKSTSNRN